MNLFLGALAAAGILLFFGGLVASRTRGLEPDVMDEYLPTRDAGPTNPREAFTGAMEAFNRILSSRPRTSKVADQLARADIKLRVSEYFLVVSLMSADETAVELL